MVPSREAGGGSWVLDEGVYLGRRDGAGSSSSLPAPRDSHSPRRGGILLVSRTCLIGGQNPREPARCRSTFSPWAAQVWTLICSHHVVELLKDNHGAPQPSSNKVSQPFIQATARSLRDTLEVLGTASLWFGFPRGGL